MSIIETLKEYDITSIWHFTDQSNLSSIEKYGIHSLRSIVSHDIDVSRFGADSLSHELDARYGLDMYVHLAFIDDHPMYHVARRRGSIKNPAWINIDISVLFENTTVFSDQVANSSYAQLFNINDVERMISFNRMISHYNAPFFLDQ